MRAVRGSSALDYAISALTEAEYDDLMKEAEDDSKDLFKESTMDSGQFEVPNFEISDVSKSPKGYEVTYKKGKHPLKGSQDFEKALIVQKGYEPINVGTKDDTIVVNFEKTR